MESLVQTADGGLDQSAATLDGMVDVGGNEPGQAVPSTRRSLLELKSSPKKGTEMLSRLVKLQSNIAALRDDCLLYTSDAADE